MHAQGQTLLVFFFELANIIKEPPFAKKKCKGGRKNTNHVCKIFTDISSLMKHLEKHFRKYLLNSHACNNSTVNNK
jgi:hypothetical protein